MKKAPTLNDVAKKAGVSTATVSRCLNTPDRVGKDTRAKVLEAVEALGYTPNYAAQVMAAKRSRTIGAIIPTMDNAIFARGLQAFQEALGQAGYTLLVSSSAYDPEREADQIRALVARGADGLLLIGQDRAAKVYDYVTDRNVPTVAAWVHDPNGRVPTIGFDNRVAMAALADRVLALGHRRIAMISGRVTGNDRARGRVAGVADALARQGIDATKQVLVEAPYTIAGGEAAMAQILAQPHRPSAVICGNDVLAVGALRKAQELGLKVPQDISITGFDDIELAQVVQPALTTVHVPHSKMGREAAAQLLAMVEKDVPGQAVSLETRIVERGSLAAP